MYNLVSMKVDASDVDGDGSVDEKDIKAISKDFLLKS